MPLPEEDPRRGQEWEPVAHPVFPAIGAHSLLLEPRPARPAGCAACLFGLVAGPALWEARGLWHLHSSNPLLPFLNQPTASREVTLQQK